MGVETSCGISDLKVTRFLLLKISNVSGLTDNSGKGYDNEYIVLPTPHPHI